MRESKPAARLVVRKRSTAPDETDQNKEIEMEVRFYNGRLRVYTVSASTTRGAIELMESTGIEWTRYKIY